MGTLPQRTEATRDPKAISVYREDSGVTCSRFLVYID